MLIKVLILIIIFLIIYIAFFKQSTKVKSKPKTNKTNHKSVSGEILMECNECQTFVAQDDAIIKDGKYYCSKECAGVK